MVLRRWWSGIPAVLLAVGLAGCADGSGNGGGNGGEAAPGVSGTPTTPGARQAPETPEAPEAPEAPGGPVAPGARPGDGGKAPPAPIKIPRVTEQGVSMSYMWDKLTRELTEECGGTLCVELVPVEKDDNSETCDFYALEKPGGSVDRGGKVIIFTGKKPCTDPSKEPPKSSKSPSGPSKQGPSKQGPSEQGPDEPEPDTGESGPSE